MTRRSVSAPAFLLAAPTVVALLLCGCRGLRDRVAERVGEQEDPEAYKAAAAHVLRPKPVKRAEPYRSDTIVVDEVAPDEGASVTEEVKFPQSPAPTYPTVDVGAYPTTLVKGMKEPNEMIKVDFDFDETSVQEIVPIFAAHLNFGYQVDPSVKGAITLRVPECEMTAREVWSIFEHILWLAGAYPSNNIGFIHVVPFEKMPEERRLLATHQPLANVEVAFIRIYHVASADIIKNVQPFMTKGASVTDLTALNTLLFVEAPPNMPKLRELIARLDDPGEAKWPHACIQCHEVDAEELLAELEELLPVLGYPVANKGPSGGKIKLTALPRLSTIVVSAALPEVLRDVSAWIRTLDVGDSTSKEDIFFYGVKHSTAEQLNEMLEVFFNTDSTTSSSTVSKTKSTSAKTTATTGSKTTTAADTTTKPATKTKRIRSDEELTDSIFDTPVVVYVDKEHNSLTLKTTRRAFSLIQAMLERHDISPRLVMVEAKIVEVNLGKNTEYGFAWAVQHTDWQAAINNMGSDDAGTTRGAWTDTNTTWTGKTPVTALYPGNPTNFTSSAGGVALGYLQGDSMAFINAVAGEGNSRVISSPQVTATNGVQAEIKIGRKVSIKTTEYSSDYRSDFQYEETGTMLTVTPYITAGNDVRLEIQQEVSSVIEGTGGEGSPDISNKNLNTTLVIPDGGTAIMGGLIDASSSEGHTGVPLLKDIPLFGRLFRTNQRQDSRSELLVLISVNVLDVGSDATPLLKRYQKALKTIQEQLD